MGYYSVVRPCVVGKLHYATVPVQPVEVDDEVAAPLVENGSLQPYEPGIAEEKTGPRLANLYLSMSDAANRVAIEEQKLAEARERGAADVDIADRVEDARSAEVQAVNRAAEAHKAATRRRKAAED
ncbi:Gp15 protein [Mycolicibacterium canariasense]|uniref:Gp15 protein n=1 Tax=Mycolicibacterium canariasense TaxID=228230 RepID=A0A117I9X3_MYCCR|nr:hypothetical protein [Mycolicibacterium canariasense]MCV7212662.1 hypothetical protein [Mycolicibacterium canariasense]ORV02503.1 hypothetical protein AWB94_00760 [Mycolicibacterium canariasense]GAS95465.1 Gp15 protein [Mycolicibacterium canariasense]